MSKPLSGKRRYKAMGRSAQARGLPLIFGRLERQPWPTWAKCAWTRGWMQQQTSRRRTQWIAQGFEENAAERGISRRECVADVLANDRLAPMITKACAFLASLDNDQGGGNA